MEFRQTCERKGKEGARGGRTRGYSHGLSKVPTRRKAHKIKGNVTIFELGFCVHKNKPYENRKINKSDSHLCS